MRILIATKSRCVFYNTYLNFVTFYVVTHNKYFTSLNFFSIQSVTRENSRYLSSTINISDTINKEDILNGVKMPPVREISTLIFFCKKIFTTINGNSVR